MSTVRMCDFTQADGKVCGTIFSEREEGWSTGTVTVMAADLNIGTRARTESIDLCPEHSPSGVVRKPKYPRLLATNPVSATDDPWAPEKS